jgi:hypothetical protein
MKIQEYLRPRLVGPRFERHAIPLEFLRDLAVLEEMIVEVAKWKFLEDHPGRKRSPRGFADGITLTLSAVEDGSAVAVIALLLGSAVSQPNQVYFEQARAAIIGAIGAVAENQPVTAFLPEKALAYFDRFGRSLREGEAIEFPAPNPGDRPARLTKEVRRKLLLASSEVKELTEEIQIRGAIHEANLWTMSFEIMLADGSVIPAPIASQHLDSILEAFHGFRQGVKVLLQGVGKYNRLERLQAIDSVEHLTLLDPQDIPARLEELKMLKDGWLDGRGSAPSAVGLDWLANVFEGRYSEDLPLPYVYPVAEGGVQLEWSLQRQEASLEIDLEQKRGEWHVLDLNTGQEESKQLNLAEETAWNWLIARLTGIAGVAQSD